MAVFVTCSMLSDATVTWCAVSHVCVCVCMRERIRCKSSVMFVLDEVGELAAYGHSHSWCAYIVIVSG